MNDRTLGSAFDGRFRLNAVLGRGGFATVYDATDEREGRRIALKVLLRKSESPYTPGTRARFDREVVVLGQLSSPYTVQLLDHGEASDGDLWMAFEFLPGVDLAELLAERQVLTPDIVTRILVQVLKSLDEAHRAGVLHRDIKPENIRILDQTTWSAKLLDFGIARADTGTLSKLTATGMLIGTPKYMSPEQLTERPLSPASDLYSLGLVAFEMLIGRAASHGNKWGDQLDRLQSGYLFAAPGGESEPLHAVIQRMTDRKVANRFQSAAQVLAALPVPASTPRSVVEERRPLPVKALVGIAVVILLAGAVLLGLQDSEPEHEPVPVPRTRTNVSSLIGSADAATPEIDAAPTPPSLDSGVDTSAPAILGGCGKAPPFKGMGLLHDDPWAPGWDTYVPAGYTAQDPVPLVVMLHGFEMETETWLRDSGFRELSEEHGFVVIAPLATNESSGRTRYPLRSYDWSGSSAPRIVRSIVDSTMSSLCIDENRIFVVAQGISGPHAVSLIQDGWVAAVATSGSRTNSSKSRRERVLGPVLQIHPLHAPRLPVAGGNPACSRKKMRGSVEEIDRRWLEYHGCRGKPRDVQVGHNVCRRWNCTVSYETCEVRGGEAWPGMPAYNDGGCESGPAVDFPTAEVMWDFFTRMTPDND